MKLLAAIVIFKTATGALVGVVEYPLPLAPDESQLVTSAVLTNEMSSYRVVSGQLETMAIPTNETHIVCDRTTVPEKSDKYAGAWDIAATLQRYQVPAEATGIKAVYFLAALAQNETDPVKAQGIRDDGQRLSGLLLFLGVDWRQYLARYETETRQVTVWRKVE